MKAMFSFITFCLTKNTLGIIFCQLFVCISLIDSLYAQSWTFVKEENGIKLYTRQEPSSSLKSYKGVMTFHAPIEKACSMVGNARNFDWWGPDFKNIKVLAYQKDKFVHYYYIYDMPWPFTDRDLAVNATVQTDTLTGEYTVTSKPLLNAIPVKKDLVRITKYNQKWSMLPLDNGNVQVTLEGILDPGGNVPSWLYNMLVTEMPMKTLGLLRDRILSDKPANK